MFVNCSNHSSAFWSVSQKQGAEVWGKIVDYPFPYVSPSADETEIKELAEKTVKEIMKMQPEAVMCQGEFTLTYAIVTMLKERGILVVSACSARETTEQPLSDGSVQKISQFRFVRFRKY